MADFREFTGSDIDFDYRALAAVQPRGELTELAFDPVGTGAVVQKEIFDTRTRLPAGKRVELKKLSILRALSPVSRSAAAMSNSENLHRRPFLPINNQIWKTLQNKFSRTVQILRPGVRPTGNILQPVINSG